jgi:hypothetical protein
MNEWIDDGAVARFTKHCRREAEQFPRPSLDEIAPRRFVSHDSISGTADGDGSFSPFDSTVPAFLRRQAD